MGSEHSDVHSVDQGQRIRELASLAERHEVVAELLAREHMFETAFRTSPFSKSITSMSTGRYIDLNGGTEQLLGYSRDELIGHTREEMGIWVDPDDREMLRTILRNEGRISGLDIEIRRKDGEIRRARIWAAVADVDGDSMMVAVAQDVTEDYLLRDELAFSERKYNAAFHEAPFSVSLTDLELGTIIDANTETCRLLGCEMDEIIGRSTMEEPSFWPYPQERADLMATLRREGQVAAVDIHLRRKDGSMRQALLSAALMHVDGRPLMLACTHDVTEQRRLELALEQSEEQYRLIFDNIADAAYVHVVEPHGNQRLIQVNEAACRMLGCTRQELLGRTLFDVDAAPEVTRRATVGLASTGEAHMETLHRASDGRLIPVEVEVRSFTLAGQPAVLSIARDISERRRAEHAMREHANQLSALAVRLDETSEREKRRLAEALHDRVSQTLVAAMIRLGEAASGEHAVAAEAVEAAKVLVADAIAESRNITTELAPPVLYELGLERGILWLAERVQDLHGLEVQVDAAFDDAPLSDEVKMAFLRAVQELLANAAVHSKSVRARVCLREDDGVLELRVEDDGIGFDTKAACELRRGCYGLLSLRERAASVGGTLAVASKKGHGTQVTLRVPVS